MTMHCFNALGGDTRLPDYKMQLTTPMWAGVCSTIGANPAKGFDFVEFRRFFGGNKDGLANLHSEVFRVDLASLHCTKPDRTPPPPLADAAAPSTAAPTPTPNTSDTDAATTTTTTASATVPTTDAPSTTNPVSAGSDPNPLEELEAVAAFLEAASASKAAAKSVLAAAAMVDYRVGDRVQISGLVGAAQHNGSHGTVLGAQQSKGRFVVQLDPPTRAAAPGGNAEKGSGGDGSSGTELAAATGAAEATVVGAVRPTDLALKPANLLLTSLPHPHAGDGREG
jgi:hypothetical protein